MTDEKIVKEKIKKRKKVKSRFRLPLIAGVPNEVSNENEFYLNAKTYWNGVKPDLAGVMGGLPQLSALDIQESKPFLKKLIQKYEMETGRVCDIGAGIGRVSKKLFLPVFDQVYNAPVLLHIFLSYIPELHSPVTFTHFIWSVIFPSYIRNIKFPSSICNVTFTITLTQLYSERNIFQRHFRASFQNRPNYNYILILTQ